MPLYVALIAIGAALLFYSQSPAFAWDEGFHLVAARLIQTGQRPYLDYLFAQTPLNAYWNAALFRIFGDSWRVAHAAAALETTAAIALTAQYIVARFRNMSIAVAAAFLLGFNHIVFEYGGIGQAYGLCLLLLVAGFRLATAAVDRASPFLAACAGLAAGAAACSSLLTAPAFVVFGVWILLRNRSATNVTAYLAGAALGLSPLLYLFARSPRNVLFDIVGFHLFYRQAGWDDWVPHDLEVVTEWLDSAPAFLLTALAVAGMVLKRSHLCSWLLIAMTAFLMTGHPTFPSYFILVTPFAAILAAAALSKLSGARWPALVLILVMTVSLARSIYAEREDQSWPDLEAVARIIDRVTPPGAMLYADEHIYFLTRRTPPPGMEWGSGHKIEMPLSQAAPLHVLPRSELDRQVAAHRFATVETREESDVDRLHLTALYSEKAESGGCFVFWKLTPGVTP